MRINPINWYINLDKVHKVQFVIAMLLTFFSITSVSVYAWFASQEEMTLATRVNSPSNLYINAAHKEAISYFDLADINVENSSAPTYVSNGKTYAYQDFVFCVCGDKVSKYDLQLSHTSNIPFAYTLYHADEAANGTVNTKIENITYTYNLGERVIFDYENLKEDGRTANDDQKSRNYTEPDAPQIYANPVYHLKRNIVTGSPDGGFTNYYVLRISWIQQKNLTEQQREEQLDIVQNNKETDMIYITAGVS